MNCRVSAVYVPCRSACFKNVAWLHLQLHMHQGQLLKEVLQHLALAGCFLQCTRMLISTSVTEGYAGTVPVRRSVDLEV